jgi:hypothetical protein
MELRQEAAQQQVVDLLRARRAAELPLEVGGELREVLAVGANRARRRVALALEVSNERGDLGLHAASASAALKRSRLASARSASAWRFFALSRTRSPSSGKSPKAMFVGW